MDIKKEREAFELNVSPVTWERIEYNAENNIYMAKSKYWTSTIVQAVANEIDFGWKMWQLAKAQVVPEGFVLVPKKPDVDKAWSIALKRIVPPPKTNDAIQKELMCKKYVDDLYSEQDRILLDYEAMIEAQEPTND